MKTSLLTLLFIGTFTYSYSQIFIESDPFVKWKSVADGLSYTSITIEPKGSYLLSNNIDKTTEITIKVKEPKGFKEINHEVFFGIGLTVFDTDADTVIFQADDLYESLSEGIAPEFLSTLKVDFAADVKPNNILIKARFFDKNSSGSIVVDCPFHLSETIDMSANISNYSQILDQPTYRVIGQSVDGSGSHLINSSGTITSLDFNKNDKLAFQTDLNNFKSNSYFRSYTLLDQKGNTVISHTEELTSKWDGITTFEFPENLAVQPYLLTYSVENKLGRIGFSQWIHSRNDSELTPLQKDSFGELLAQIALNLMSKEQEKEAYLFIANAEYYAPENLNVLVAKGKVSNYTEKFDEALQVYEKALSIAPNSIAVISELGMAYISNDMSEKAIEMYKKCIALNPSESYYHYQIGWIYNEEQKFTEAIPYLTKAIELNKDSSNTKPYDERILANNSLKNYQAVIDDYFSLLKYYPENWDYYYQIGYVQNDKGDYKEALKSLDKAIEINEYISVPVYERAYSYKKLEKYKEAIKDFNTVLEMDKEDAPNKLYLHRGDCYTGIKENKKACEDYTKAVELEVKGAAEKLALNCK